MSDENQLLKNMAPHHLFVFFLMIFIASAVMLLFVMVGLYVLIDKGKINANMSEIFSLVFGIIAILITIVFSRLSTDIRETKERLQELVTLSLRNGEHLNDTIRSAIARIEIGNTTVQKELLAEIRSEIQSLCGIVEALNRSTDFEKMLRGLSQGPVALVDVLDEKARIPKEKRKFESENLKKEATILHGQLQFEEIAILNIFTEANESALSYDLFERYLKKKDINDANLRSAIEKLRQCGCLTIYSTALSLTALGKAIMANIDPNNIRVNRQLRQPSELQNIV